MVCGRSYKFRKKMAIFFENTKEDIIMTEKDEEDYRINKNFRFCEKNFECDDVRDPCHLTGNYRGPAHSICNINVTQGQINNIPIIFHIF